MPEGTRGCCTSQQRRQGPGCPAQARSRTLCSAFCEELGSVLLSTPINDEASKTKHQTLLSICDGPGGVPCAVCVTLHDTELGAGIFLVLHVGRG